MHLSSKQYKPNWITNNGTTQTQNLISRLLNFDHMSDHVQNQILPNSSQILGESIFETPNKSTLWIPVNFSEVTFPAPIQGTSE